MKHLIKSTVCAVVAGSFILNAAYGQDAKPDAEGYIRNWLMLAPISIEADTGADAIVKDQVEKEAALKPKAGDKIKVKGKELAWKSVQSKEAVFDFNVTLGVPQEYAAGYLVTYVSCEKEITGLTLSIGNNDQARIYLNGKEVFKYTDGTSLIKDSSKVENLTLNKGVNTIVFKVINESNNWEACLRFKDKSGKPVTDFAVKQSP